MTEQRSDETNEPPVDLTALGARDPAFEDRVVAVAMARIRALPLRSDASASLLDDVDHWWRAGLAAAATVMAVAGASMIGRPVARPTAVPVETRMLEWIESGYTPRNGDLLAAFVEDGR